MRLRGELGDRQIGCVPDVQLKISRPGIPLINAGRILRRPCDGTSAALVWCLTAHGQGSTLPWTPRANVNPVKENDVVDVLEKSSNLLCRRAVESRSLVADWIRHMG